MKEKQLLALRKLFHVATAFLICWMLIRIYEWMSITSRITGSISLMDGVYDLSTGLSIAFGIVLLTVMISFLHSRVAYFINVLLFAFALAIGFAVTQYFTVTLIPLSADLFGYSYADIVTTVSSSGSMSLLSVVFSVLLFASFFLLQFLFNRKNIFQNIRYSGLLVMLLGGLIAFCIPLSPSAEKYEHESDYFVAVNKVEYLASQALVYFEGHDDQISFSEDSYPLLHPAEYTNSIGQYLNKSAVAPNLVFILVEGLGRDFVGADAPYHGFTPFLDSLTEKSLYWKNALSNAGRTFGAPPSILGSLPYGESGLMNYGNHMPDHQTILTLLKPYGYHTNFFYGGNPNFDNLDIFLERQGIDRFINQSSFPDSIKVDKASAAWGYNDRDVFAYASRLLEKQSEPRVDVYLTLSTHEPFNCPDSTIKNVADSKIRNMIPSALKDKMEANTNIFECLEFTDNAIRKLIQSYSKRSDFSNTIFVITGDHRLIPMPSDNPLERFHVPLMIYSPLIKRAYTFSSLALHSSIPPTLLALLKDDYGMSFPSEMPFISKPLLTDSIVSSNLDVAMIRNKNSIKEYIEGNYFLSDDKLYRIESDLSLTSIHQSVDRSRLQKKLVDFQNRSIFALNKNRLDKPAIPVQKNTFILTQIDLAVLNREHVANLNPDQQFERARQLTFAKDFTQSKSILKNLLNNSPNYHDVRIFLARTYAWQQQYDSATLFIRQVIARAPLYTDAYVSLSDVEFWQSKLQQSLEAAEQGLKASPSNEDLLVRKARALEALGKKSEAKNLVSQLIKKDSHDELALVLWQKLNNK